MPSFMELIFIDSEDLAQKTGLTRSLDSDAETWAEFQSYRRFGVEIEEAKFLLDYYNRKGDLADSIAIDANGFTEITGQAPKTDATYRKIDRDFWRAAQATADGECNG